MAFEPRFTINARILDNLIGINGSVIKMGQMKGGTVLPMLRRANRLKSLHSSLAIEGNTLSLDDVSAIIDGKRVIGPKDEITEVRNAYSAYEGMDSFDPFDRDSLLKAHALMMDGLMEKAGSFRTGTEGVFDSDGNLVYLAPPPDMVPELVDDLLGWTNDSDYPMIVRSCIFHYQFEYIHPFEDGNGRVGRLWQTLLLSKYDESFKWIPVESIIRMHQKEYYHAIEQSNLSCDCTVFLEFMTGAILEALEGFEGSVVGEQVGRNVRLLHNETVLYAMIRDGYFGDIRQAAKQMDVSRATVNRCLASLKEKGLIRKEGNRKSGIWVAVRP